MNNLSLKVGNENVKCFDYKHQPNNLIFKKGANNAFPVQPKSKSIHELL